MVWLARMNMTFQDRALRSPHLNGLFSQISSKRLKILCVILDMCVRKSYISIVKFQHRFLLFWCIRRRDTLRIHFFLTSEEQSDLTPRIPEIKIFFSQNVELPFRCSYNGGWELSRADFFFILRLRNGSLFVQRSVRSMEKSFQKDHETVQSSHSCRGLGTFEIST